MPDAEQKVATLPAAPSAYEVWGVFDPGLSAPRIEGFIVMDRSRLPLPIAWVEGKDEIAFLTAKRIAEGRRSPESSTNDLRGRPFPQWLLTKPMIPLESGGTGPVIGIFSAPSKGPHVVFMLVNNPALKQVAGALENLRSAGDGETIMAWDAGSIVGKLMLDIDGEGGFATSMMTAEGIARLFPELVTDFLTDPILGFADALKETGETAIDTFKEIQQDAENVGLSSLKLGVSPEFFSEWSKIGETVQVGQAELSQGLRFLELNAQEALEGSKKAAKGFADVGISMSDLRAHEGDAAWLFEKSREGLQRLAAGQERVLAGKEVMGKGGQSLLPLLLMEQQHVDDLTKSLNLFGDTVDAGEVKAAQKFQDLESVGSWAMEGIQKAFEKPVLDYLADHAQQIQGVITEATDWTIGKVNELWGWIDGPKGHAALEWVETEGKTAWQGIKNEVSEVEDGVELAWDKMQDPETRAALQGIKGDFKELWGLG